MTKTTDDYLRGYVAGLRRAAKIANMIKQDARTLAVALDGRVPDLDWRSGTCSIIAELCRDEARKKKKG